MALHQPAGQSGDRQTGEQDQHKAALTAIASAALAPTSSIHSNTVTSMASGQAGLAPLRQPGAPGGQQQQQEQQNDTDQSLVQPGVPTNSAAGPTAFSQGVRGEGVSVSRSWRLNGPSSACSGLCNSQFSSAGRLGVTAGDGLSLHPSIRSLLVAA